MDPIPDPALIWLVGPSGSGKSTWAAKHYRNQEVVSSDELRSRVGSGEGDLAASGAAFDVLERIAVSRLSRGMTAVVDTLGTDEALRDRLAVAAVGAGLERVAVVFESDLDVSRTRNQQKNRPLSVAVLRAQIERHESTVEILTATGWRILKIKKADSSPPGAPSGDIERVPPRGRKLKFFLHIARFEQNASDGGRVLMEQATAAAEAGFSGISLMDHLIQIPQVGRPWDPILDPLVALSKITAIAPGLEVGALVSPVTFRSPPVLAKALATLDVLSGGKTFCGLGAGWYTKEHAGLGLNFPKAGLRIDLLEETVGALRALWGPGSKPFQGDIVDIPDTTSYPRPVHGTIPILIGGGGERRTLPLVARLADRWNLPGGFGLLPGKLDRLRQLCTEIGRDPDEIEVSILDPVLVGSDRAEVAELVERHRGRADAVDFSARVNAGIVEQHAERYQGMAAAGVDTVFVTLVDGDPASIRKWSAIIAG